MRTCPTIPLTSLLCALPSLAWAQSNEPLTVRSLEDALRIAATHHPALQLAEQRLARTRLATEQILASASRPNVSASATYTRLSGLGAAFGGGAFGVSPAQIQNPFPVGLSIQPPGSAPIALAASPTRSRQTDDGGGDSGGSGNGGGSNFFGTPSLDQRSVRVGITQLVDLTGIVRTASQIGSIEERSVLLEIQRTRLEVGLAVKTAWFGLLRTDALVRVAEAAVAQSNESLRVSESQFRAGTVAAFDVLRAKTQVANNRQSLISAKNQRLLAGNAFANSLGINPSTPVDTPSATSLADLPELPSLPNLAESVLLERAMRQRPEIGQASLNIEKASKATRLARRNLEPFATVALSGNYNPNPALVANEKSTGSLSITVTAPIYDGGATRAGIESAHADERSAQIQSDQFRRGVQAEVQQAAIAVRDADERAKTALASLAEAREAFRLAGVRYREGVDTQLAVNDAQTALVQSETNAVNARYDLLAALAQLARAVGDPL